MSSLGKISSFIIGVTGFSIMSQMPLPKYFDQYSFPQAIHNEHLKPNIAKSAPKAMSQSPVSITLQANIPSTQPSTPKKIVVNSSESAHTPKVKAPVRKASLPQSRPDIQSITPEKITPSATKTAEPFVNNPYTSAPISPAAVAHISPYQPNSILEESPAQTNISAGPDAILTSQPTPKKENPYLQALHQSQ